MNSYLVLCLALFGNIAIATVRKVTTQETLELHPNPNANNVPVSAIESKAQLVQSLTTNLLDANLFGLLVKDTRKFDEYSATFSPNVQQMVGQLRSLFLGAEDNVFDAIRPVFGWCSRSKTLLTSFLELLPKTESKYIPIRNDIIQNVLTDGFTRHLSEKLGLLSTNLDTASTTVTSILSQFDTDFTDTSPIFKSTLRDELVRDKNQRYTPELINQVVKAMFKFKSNPQLLAQELNSAQGTINIAQTIIGQQQSHDPNTAFEQANHQQQQQQQQSAAESSATNQQHSNAPPTTTPAIDPQRLTQFKNRVLEKFEKTRTLFTNFQQQLAATISRVSEIESTVQASKSLQVTGNTAAQNDQIIAAVYKLKEKCASFNAKSSRN